MKCSSGQNKYFCSNANVIAVTAAAVNFEIIEEGCQVPVQKAMMTLSSGEAFLSFRIDGVQRKLHLIPLLTFLCVCMNEHDAAVLHN